MQSGTSVSAVSQGHTKQYIRRTQRPFRIPGSSKDKSTPGHTKNICGVHQRQKTQICPAKWKHCPKCKQWNHFKTVWRAFQGIWLFRLSVKYAWIKDHASCSSTHKGASCLTWQVKGYISQKGTAGCYCYSWHTNGLGKFCGHCGKKTSGKLRVCNDARDLYMHIQRSHNPMRTIDDVLSKLSGAQNLKKDLVTGP